MNKALYLLLFLFLFIMSGANAENPQRVTIKGTVKDTLNEPAAYATVMLLNPADSTLANFTTSNDAGSFAFNNVRNIPYILKISHVSYLPVQLHLQVAEKPLNDLGFITIKPISQTLMEVVIKAAKAPLYIKGDTIEYDATTFKVPPGSTVEDLLRRLPGIEVDGEGNISTQGKTVKKVTVDGKSFFGDDPKSVTKNLEAQAISKVQVYDDKSEQAKLTGIDDGTKEKAMNLALKDEYKKGSFGKLSLAAGDQERVAARGNYNRFNDKEQLSFIAFGNNINQTGINWEDYGEFKGQNSFSSFDNGDFGFNSGGGRMIYFGGDDIALNSFDGRGFTRNAGGGANYNFDNKKSKYNASYFYNQSKLNFDQYSFRQTFLGDSSLFNTDTTSKTDSRRSHSIATRLERNIDSVNVIIAKANVRFSTSDLTSGQVQHYLTGNDIPVNTLTTGNTSNLSSWNITSAAIFRHRFKKKGRTFAMSAGYNDALSGKEERLENINNFFKATTFTDQMRHLNQNDNRTAQAKSSVLFTEPLSKKWFLESFYNFSFTNNDVNRQVKNNMNGQERIDSLSRYYSNDVMYNRLGSSIRYANKGLNVSAGIAAQQINMQGKIALDKGLPILSDSLKKAWFNWTPNLSASYQLPRNMWLEAGYNFQVNEPAFTDLQPVFNVSNPLYRVEGNPALEPETSHNFNLGFNYWNAASFANIGIGMNFSLYDNNIVYNQIVSVVDNVGVVTITRPENMKGGNSSNGYLWSNIPIIKTKLSLYANGGGGYSSSPALINTIENTTESRNVRVGAGLNITPSAKLLLDISGNINMNNISYSIREDQNQKIRQYSVNTSVKWQFLPKTFFEGNFSFDRYKNDRLGFNRNVPLWNSSVRRLLGKKNRFEMRLAAFDILNQRIYISQYGTQNYVYKATSPTLARYFMASVTYNIKGFEDKIKKNNFW